MTNFKSRTCFRCFCTVMLFLMVISVTVLYAADETCYTPGDNPDDCHTVYIFSPLRWCLGDMGTDVVNFHVSCDPPGGNCMGQKYTAGYYTVFDPPPLDVPGNGVQTFEWFIQDFMNVLGVLVINSYMTENGLAIESYQYTGDGLAQRDAAYHDLTTGPDSYSKSEIMPGEIPGLAYTIDATLEFVDNRCNQPQSLVYINASMGYNFADAFCNGGARVAIGPTEFDCTSMDLRQMLTAFFSRMNGRGTGISEDQRTTFRRVVNAVLGLNLGYAGDGNTTLSPAITEWNLPCPPEVDDVVDIYFDTWCDANGSPPNISGWGGYVEIEDEQWVIDGGIPGESDHLTAKITSVTIPPWYPDWDDELRFYTPTLLHYDSPDFGPVKSVRNASFMDGGAQGPAHDDEWGLGSCPFLIFPACDPERIRPIIPLSKSDCIFDSLVIPGHYANVPISISADDFEMGGFDFLIAYDASALTAIEVSMGQLLEDCNWEYFTYRYGISGNCGTACPSGMLRIVSMAETNNGSVGPLCFGPPDGSVYQLANIKFLATGDRTYECQFVPIRFFWDDCGDNSISTIGGEYLYIDEAIYDDDGNLLWNEFDDAQFPESGRLPFVGAPDDCLNDDPLKPSASRKIHFINGGIRIMCSDSIDDRGDINLNGVPNEIADATVFTNYFLHGLSAFAINTEGQIAATDVNADGLVLSVADLVYLIRIIIGDALPYPKLSPATVGFSLENGILSVDAQIGAAYVEIAGNTAPELLAPHMELKYSYDAGRKVTRALVYSMEEGMKFEGDFLTVDGELVKIELATYEGAVVRLGNGLKPTEFILHQNRPNPFNSATVISFSLPRPLDVTLEVLNVTGQKVAAIAKGRFEAGIHTVRWDADGVASGVYFYRMAAGDFEDTRKMLILK